MRNEKLTLHQLAHKLTLRKLVDIASPFDDLHCPYLITDFSVMYYGQVLARKIRIATQRFSSENTMKIYCSVTLRFELTNQETAQGTNCLLDITGNGTSQLGKVLRSQKKIDFKLSCQQYFKKSGISFPIIIRMNRSIESQSVLCLELNHFVKSHFRYNSSYIIQLSLIIWPA